MNIHIEILRHILIVLIWRVFLFIEHRGNFSEQKTIKMANNVHSILMGWINIQLSIF